MSAEPEPVREPLLPFSLPDITDDEISEVVDALRSGWVTTGPRTVQFEAAVAGMHDPELHAVAVNSATAGLHLALEALGIGPGDEVLVPTWTFTATAEVVRYLGADPVLVDVDAATLNIDFDDAVARITPRTRAVLPVHFAGYPLNLRELATWASRTGLEVVDDAAHAFMSASEGRLVGTVGARATVFSFYATKTMTTGEGGMILTRDPNISSRCRTMRLHGIDRDAFARYRSDVSGWRYDVVAPGFKYNLGDMAAALGMAQLRRAKAMRNRREEIAATYLDAFADLQLEMPAQTPPVDQHSWHLFVVRTTSQCPSRDDVLARLTRDGVGTSVHFIPLHKLSYWRERYNLRDQDFPVASREFERVISLPIYSRMSDDDVERVIGAVQRAAS